ncbi:hypothetical protein EV426DRAFT_582704, partial [Tirmania nivea]
RSTTRSAIQLLFNSLPVPLLYSPAVKRSSCSAVALAACQTLLLFRSCTRRLSNSLAVQLAYYSIVQPACSLPPLAVYPLAVYPACCLVHLLFSCSARLLFNCSTRLLFGFLLHLLFNCSAVYFACYTVLY